MTKRASCLLSLFMALVAVIGCGPASLDRPSEPETSADVAPFCLPEEWGRSQSSDGAERAAMATIEVREPLAGSVYTTGTVLPIRWAACASGGYFDSGCIEVASGFRTLRS